MYKKLRFVLLALIMAILSLLSIWYVDKFENQMFGGEEKLIAVNESKIDVMQEFEYIAQKYNITFGKQIWATSDEYPQGRNTFAKIGKKELPLSLIKQTDSSIIKKSPNNVIYVIVGNGISLENIVKHLNDKGNKVEIFDNDWRFVFLGNFFKPTLAIGVVILLATYCALIMSEFVGEIKRFGIYRLAGRGKHTLAFQGIITEAIVIFGEMLVGFILSIFFLNLNSYLFKQVLEMILFTFVGFSLLLLVTYSLLSVVVFYTVQHQSINLSIKGKAPLKSVIIVIIVFQIFSITSSMFSFLLFQDTQLQYQRLKQGEDNWKKNKDYFGLTSIGFDRPNPEKIESFLVEVLNEPETLLVSNQFSTQEFGRDPKGAGGYFPREYPDSNILYVNSKFLKKSDIRLETSLQEKIDQLQKGEYALLIPKSQEKQAEQISNAWAKRMELWNQKTKPEDLMNFRQIKGIYKDDHRLFVYSVKGVTQVSNRNFVTSPLLMVYSPKSFAGNRLFNFTFVPMIRQILIKEPDKIADSVKKYGLENSIGSFENGYSALLGRMSEKEGEYSFTIITNFLSLVSSLLLVYLLNTIYLYQNRRKFLIERLSGKSFINIHQNYLTIVVGAAVLVALLSSLVFHFPILTLIVPLIYLISILLLFTIQVNRDKKISIQYLKGE